MVGHVRIICVIVCCVIFPMWMTKIDIFSTIVFVGFHCFFMRAMYWNYHYV